MDKFKLPDGIKKGWLQALRSGEYKQARGSLRQNDRYCCLGVLADACGALDDDGRCVPRLLGGADDTTGSWVNLTTHHFGEPLVLPRNLQNNLVDMNDGGATFDEIADWIEENL